LLAGDADEPLDRPLKLQEMRAAGESAWQNMRAGMDSAWASMKTALDKASFQFKK